MSFKRWVLFSVMRYIKVGSGESSLSKITSLNSLKVVHKIRYEKANLMTDSLLPISLNEFNNDASGSAADKAQPEIENL